MANKTNTWVLLNPLRKDGFMVVLAMGFGTVLVIALVIVGLAMLVVVFTRNGIRESNKRRSFAVVQQSQVAVVGDYRLCSDCNEVIELTAQILEGRKFECPSCGLCIQFDLHRDRFYEEPDLHRDDGAKI